MGYATQLIESRTQNVQHHTMHFHLLSLSTHEPHPRASIPVLQWPVSLLRRNISLAFQICDDGMFVLSQNIPGRPHCQLSGWQWTTGRLAVVSTSVCVLVHRSTDTMADIEGAWYHVV